MDSSDSRIIYVDKFDTAVRFVLQRSDIILTWGISNLQQLLPAGRLPKFVIVSKDSGNWAQGFLHLNSLLTTSLVANSTSSATAFPAAVRRKVTVIHDGINPARVIPHKSRAEQRREWGLSTADKVVGYLGRIEHDKGVSLIVDAMPYLPHDWTVVFVGVSPTSRYAAALEEHCRHAIPGRYRLLDWCHDIGSALRAFDVFCHPSEHEGFSNSIGEAWLAGVPTVYTANTGAIPDVGDLGIPVSPDAGGGEIATAVRRALHNETLISRAKEVIESRFLIGNNIQRWTNYLTELHSRPTRPRVMLIFPAEFLHYIPAWVGAFPALSMDFDICCLLRALDPRSSGSLEYLGNECPVFYVSAASQVSQAIRYTRPDFILTFQGGSSTWLIPHNTDVPVIYTGPDPRGGGANWARWLHHLALSRAEYVHQ